MAVARRAALGPWQPVWLGSFWLPFSRKLSGLRYLHGSHYGGDAITDLRRLFAARLIPARIMRDCCQIEPLSTTWVQVAHSYRRVFASRKLWFGLIAA
jgi:hypothetical protein